MFEPPFILQTVERLRTADPKLELFGAFGHEYRFNSRLSEVELAQFEERHKVNLPKDYRLFLREVGNGGAGPAYGVFPLGIHDSNDEFCRWEEGSLVGDLSKPFLHVNDWNLPDEFWADSPATDTLSEDEADAAMETWYQRLDAVYWAPSIVDGAIPICHLGCARRIWLIVNGPSYGQVWEDDRVDQAGLRPIMDGHDERLHFDTWYMQWLHDAVSKVSEQSGRRGTA